MRFKAYTFQGGEHDSNHKFSISGGTLQVTLPAVRVLKGQLPFLMLSSFSGGVGYQTKSQHEGGGKMMRGPPEDAGVWGIDLLPNLQSDDNAGKTSTLNMLTGAVLPSGGQAFLGGYDVVQEQRKVRRLLGFCPQHDALLDRLTVREHLELFGRIKGIPSHAIKELCDQMMQDLSLSPHVDKLAMTLSGGNKRKLSLAIALMASPPLVFLDEPSTGVDPAARRLMWHVISAVSTMRRESTVILTTHNMEEAEALCSRVGIMVGGRLRCFGSNQRLKARFGQGYQLEARLCAATRGECESFVRELQLPEKLDASAVTEQCAAAGKPGRAHLIRQGCEEGYAVYDSLSREGSISALHFAEWWLFEDSAAMLNAFLERHFPGTVALERHEHNFRFRLPAQSSLGEVFRLLEESRRQLSLEDYGVSQTSLEQIFNDFAAMQQEETGPVQGLFVEGRQVQTNGAEVDARAGSVELISSPA
ncbi:ABCA1 [Symbiodinium natans]|uniref:ABCA1 protein n=1 Tax=Symbiodinium natans TaxID=878477 RepID=A0A812G9N2_9DINO|nr:ABCA1 [Symbiodinium natans]